MLPPKTIFDKLEEYGYEVENRLFSWFLVYDFESMMVPVHEKNIEKLEWTRQHIPVAVSICSNVEDFNEPVCIVEPEVDELVKK